MAPAGAASVKSGKRFEDSIRPWLEGTRYLPTYQHNLKTGKPWGGRMVLDVYLQVANGDRIAISQKNQSGPGSAEEKVWWELLQLSHLVANQTVHRAYLVIMGDGWSAPLKNYLFSPGIKQFLPSLAWGTEWDERLTVVTFDQLTSKIHKGSL